MAIVCPHKVPLAQFAKDMLETDVVFADRVRNIEKQFGAADDDTLAVLAQAAYFCWFEFEYENDLVEVCRAIGVGKPTSMHLCLQVSPERWAEMNTYVVGVQRWLGLDLPLPNEVDGAKVEQTKQWLGDRNPAREALAQLFLVHLLDQLLFRASLAKMGGDTQEKRREYTDFAPWYARPGGLRSGTGQEKLFIEKCKLRVHDEMSLAPRDAEELIERILQPRETIQPACMHRFSRYMDIKLASIGALKWRGRLPPDDGSKEKWKTFREEATDALESWAEGALPAGELAVGLHDALGLPTMRSKAIVRAFLLAEKTGCAAFYHWLEERAREEGTFAGSFSVGSAF